VKKIRQRLTYANVMSSLAVFLILGGATAFAASKIGANQLKANSVLTGKIKKEAVTTSKLKNNSVTTSKLADGAVTGSKIVASTLGEVPLATEAKKLGGQTAASFVLRSSVLWAVVNNSGTLIQGSGAVSSSKTSTGRYQVTFNRNVTSCVSIGAQTDAGGGEPPAGTDARIVATDNVEQPPTEADKVNVTTTNPAGVQEDPASGDGVSVTVVC
jgi:hypothetical protein